MIWKVKVLCEAHGKTVAKKPKPIVLRHWVTCLVEAENDHDAFGNAMEFAMNVAPFGPKWESFDAREAVQLSLPYQL